MPLKKKVRVTKQTVFEAIDDLVAKFLIHDREEDDHLPGGEIERMLASEALTVDDLVDKFRESLEEHLEDLEPEAQEEEDEEDEDDLGEDGYEGDYDD